MLRVLVPILIAPIAIASADHRPPPHPPQAAIDACKSSQRGDACSVSLDGHTLTGKCDAPPDVANAPLACRPDGPPPEAIAACDGASEGDACTLTHDGHSAAGTCVHGPGGRGPLACRPEGAP